VSWRALFQPAGRRGARVYWRRRLLAFGLLFLAVLGAFWAVAHRGAPQPAGAPVYAVASPIPPSASASAPASPPGAAPQAAPDVAGGAAAQGAQQTAGPPASDAAAPTTPGAADSVSPAQSAPGEAPTACQDQDVSVRVTPSALQVNRGGAVTFTLVVSDRGLGPCDVAGLTRTVQVVGGAGPVWSSARCGSPAIGPTVVSPGAPATFQVSWSTRSCGAAAEPVTSGAYDVIGRVGAVNGFGGTLTVS